MCIRDSPVTDRAGHRHVCGVDFPLPEIYTCMTQSPASSGYATLFDPEGVIVYHPDSLKLGRPASDPTGLAAFRKVAATGQRVTVHAISDYLGIDEERIYYPIQLGGRRWVAGIGIPRLVIVTLLLLVLQPGMVTIIFALMLTEWVGMSRIARAEMLKLKDQEFVLASRTLGAGSFFIIFKEVLPNIIGPIITQVMFSIPTAIFTEAFLSFVGLGIPVPQCSLGSLISELYNSFTTHPYQIIPPIVVMSLLMLSFNLVADGLREALDPKMKSM